MTEDQWAYLDGYVADLAARLRLSTWRITLSHEWADQSDGSNDARSFIRNAADQSTVYLAQSFLDGDADARRETIVHELLHCHFNRQDRTVEMYGDYVPKIVWETVFRQYREAQDVAIEHLSWILAPLMPPLELPKDDDAGS